MDPSNNGGANGVSTPVKGDDGYIFKSLASSLNDNKNQYVRADSINLRTFGVELEKMNCNLSWSMRPELHKKEEWRIDVSKVESRHVIAQGTYGTVYRAVYDGQDVAVKVLDWGEDSITPSAATASLRASFKQEVSVWHKLDHPNITKFIGASLGTSKLKLPCTDPPNESQVSHPSKACCLVAEYLPGGTLKNYLYRNRRKKIPFMVVIQLALDMARGLSYLHSQNIIHRDVKTENMLLDTRRTLKIADFGVARVEAQNSEDMTGETGTLGYMAPEVINGQSYNRKCDVYSYGICLWEMYCCDLAYPNMNFAEMSSAIVLKKLRPKIPKCCPKPLARIMKKCWDANPEKRPDMADVIRLLEAIDTSKGGGMIPEDQAPGCLCFGTPRGP